MMNGVTVRTWYIRIYPTIQAYVDKHLGKLQYMQLYIH